MKKRFAAMLLALSALLGCLSGCHGSKGLNEFVLPEEFDETRTYEITFWAKNDTNMTQADLYRKVIADFQEIYPNIHVNLRLYTDYGRIYNDVITNISTQTTPNVCITYPDHIATYLTGTNNVVELNDLLVDGRYGLGGSEVRFDSPTVDEIIPEFLTECTIGENCYALPFMRSTEACYVNKTYVEALGFTLPETLTWEFVWEVSEAATARDAEGNYLINGQKVMIPFIYKSTDNMMITMLRQLGAGYSTDDGEILVFNDTTKDILETVAAHVETGAFSTFKISGYPANYLNAGQCIFAVDSTAGATWMGSDAPLLDIPEEHLVKFETEVMAIPQFDTDNPQMISQGPSVCVFNKRDPQEVLASWLFTQYLLSNEMQIAYAQTEGYVPVTTKARQTAEYQDYLKRSGEDNDFYYDVKIRATELLLENTENTFVTPVFNGSASLRDAAGMLIENTAKATNRGQTTDDAYFEKLYKDMYTLYHLDEGGAAAAGKEELGELPATAVALLGGLAAAWILIGLYLLREWRKKSVKVSADH